VIDVFISCSLACAAASVLDDEAREKARDEENVVATVRRRYQKRREYISGEGICGGNWNWNCYC
jgi:hypothetical protein